MENQFENLMKEWKEFESKGGTGEEFIFQKGIQSIEKEMVNFYLGIDEVELTDELINQLVKENKWGNVESLYQARENGAKWNTMRNSLVYPIEQF